MSIPVSQAFADTVEYSYFGYKQSFQRVAVPVLPRIQPLILGSISDELTAVEPLPINIERDEDGTFVVSDDIFLVYGSGESRELAIRDYIVSLVEFYKLCEKNSAISQEDNELFSRLKTFIQAKSQRGFNAVQANRD